MHAPPDRKLQYSKTAAAATTLPTNSAPLAPLLSCACLYLNCPALSPHPHLHTTAQAFDRFPVMPSELIWQDIDRTSTRTRPSIHIRTFMAARMASRTAPSSSAPPCQQLTSRSMPCRAANMIPAERTTATPRHSASSEGRTCAEGKEANEELLENHARTHRSDKTRRMSISPEEATAIEAASRQVLQE